MPITYVASSSGAVRPGPLVLDTPTGSTEGTVLVAVITATTGVVPPSGWTTIATEGPWSSRFIMAWYYVCDTSIPANHTFTAGGTPSLAGGIVAFDGVDTADVLDTVATMNDGGVASASVILPSITTTEDGCMLIGAAGGADAATSWTTGVMTERIDIQSPGTSQVSTGLGTEPFPTAGATGTRTFTAAASTRHGGILLAIKPGCVPIHPEPLYIPFKDRLLQLTEDFTDQGIARAQDMQFDNLKVIERWAESFMHDTLSADRCRLYIPFKDHARHPWAFGARESFDNWKQVERWAGYILDGSCGCNCGTTERLGSRCQLFVPHKNALSVCSDPTDLDSLRIVATMEFDNYKALERWAELYAAGVCGCTA